MNYNYVYTYVFLLKTLERTWMQYIMQQQQQYEGW